MLSVGAGLEERSTAGEKIGQCPPGHAVSALLMSHTTVLGMAIPKAEVVEELAKVILVPRWSPSPSPDGQEGYEAENSAPSGKRSAWHCLNHGHSRPLGQVGLPV